MASDDGVTMPAEDPVKEISRFLLTEMEQASDGEEQKIQFTGSNGAAQEEGGTESYADEGVQAEQQYSLNIDLPDDIMPVFESLEVDDRDQTL